MGLWWLRPEPDPQGRLDPIVIHPGAAHLASSVTIAPDEMRLCANWRFRCNAQDQILVARICDLLEAFMYAFLEAVWPFSAPANEPCAAAEVDVSGLSGMSLLEWLGEPAPACSGAPGDA